MIMSRGFTLIELLIYMGLMGIFIFVLTQIFLTVLDDQSESKATSSVEQDGRYIISRLQYDLLKTTTISSPALGQASSAAQLLISGSNVTYASQGGNLYLTNSNGTNQLNSYGSRVTNLTFKQLGISSQNVTLQINLTLVSTTLRQAGQVVRTIQTTIGQRCRGLTC